MLKELKYFFYILIIFIFLFITVKFYISDDNKKNSYRSYKEIDDKISIYSQNFPSRCYLLNTYWGQKAPAAA